MVGLVFEPNFIELKSPFHDGSDSYILSEKTTENAWELQIIPEKIYMDSPTRSYTFLAEV